MYHLVPKSKWSIWDLVEMYRPSPIYFEIFIILIIKPNPIYANNDPKQQNIKVWSNIKVKVTFIVEKSSILDLIEFVDLPVLNYIA